MDTTTKYYKQGSGKSELSEVYYCGGHAWLKGAQVANWSGVPGVTACTEGSLGLKKKGWHQHARWFPGTGTGASVEGRELGCWFFALVCHKL